MKPQVKSATRQQTSGDANGIRVHRDLERLLGGSHQPEKGIGGDTKSIGDDRKPRALSRTAEGGKHFVSSFMNETPLTAKRL
jgi:hypothetical protein